MITIRIPPEKDGKSLVNALSALLPDLGTPRIFRALRHRDIRVNGKRVRSDLTVAGGDQIELYLPDDQPSEAADAHRTASAATAEPAYQTVYSDDQLLIISKPAGLSVHGDRGHDEEGTLIALLKKDLRSQNLFLCHRLDRNTGGLILVARSAEMEAAVREAMQDHLIVKRYRCLVRGVPTKGMTVQSTDKSTFLELSAYLEKDARKSDVYIHDHMQRNDHPITTRYRVLQVFTGVGSDSDAVSELEVELVTGRTHQIRAHMAHIGHPLVGDGKYGRNSFNKQFRGPDGLITRQQLYAYSLIFSHKLKSPLAGMAGRTFTVPAVFDFNPAALNREG